MVIPGISYCPGVGFPGDIQRQGRTGRWVKIIVWAEYIGQCTVHQYVHLQSQIRVGGDEAAQYLWVPDGGDGGGARHCLMGQLRLLCQFSLNFWAPPRTALFLGFL